VSESMAKSLPPYSVQNGLLCSYQRGPAAKHVLAEVPVPGWAAQPIGFDFHCLLCAFRTEVATLEFISTCLGYIQPQACPFTFY